MVADSAFRWKYLVNLSAVDYFRFATVFRWSFAEEPIVPSTSQIVWWKIVSEGIHLRRSSADWSDYFKHSSNSYWREQENVLKDIQSFLKNPKDVKKAIEALIEERNSLKKKLKGLYLESPRELKLKLLNQFQS